jgi:hypothetical protein
MATRTGRARKLSEELGVSKPTVQRILVQAKLRRIVGPLHDQQRL